MEAWPILAKVNSLQIIGLKVCFKNIFNPKMHCYLQFHGAPWYFTEILSYFNWVFTLLFTVECAFKLTSFGPKVSPTVFPAKI